MQTCFSAKNNTNRIRKERNRRLIIGLSGLQNRKRTCKCFTLHTEKRHPVSLTALPIIRAADEQLTHHVGKERRTALRPPPRRRRLSLLPHRLSHLPPAPKASHPRPRSRPKLALRSQNPHSRLSTYPPLRSSLRLVLLCLCSRARFEWQ